MDFFEAGRMVRGMPDQLLAKELQRPSGMYPSFMVLAEMARRKKMRAEAAAKPVRPTITIAQALAQGGIPSLQRYADGGIVRRLPRRAKAPVVDDSYRYIDYPYDMNAFKRYRPYGEMDPTSPVVVFDGNMVDKVVEPTVFPQPPVIEKPINRPYNIEPNPPRGIAPLAEPTIVPTDRRLPDGDRPPFMLDDLGTLYDGAVAPVPESAGAPGGIAPANASGPFRRAAEMYGEMLDTTRNVVPGGIKALADEAAKGLDAYQGAVKRSQERFREIANDPTRSQFERDLAQFGTGVVKSPEEAAIEAFGKVAGAAGGVARDIGDYLGDYFLRPTVDEELMRDAQGVDMEADIAPVVQPSEKEKGAPADRKAAQEEPPAEKRSDAAPGGGSKGSPGSIAATIAVGGPTSKEMQDHIDYLNKVADALGAGRDKRFSGVTDAVEKIRAQLEKVNKNSKWLALARLGAGMAASKSPYFGQALGEGAQGAVATMEEARDQGLRNQLLVAQLDARMAEAKEMARKGDLDRAAMMYKAALDASTTRAAIAARAGGGGGLDKEFLLKYLNFLEDRRQNPIGMKERDIQILDARIRALRQMVDFAATGGVIPPTLEERTLRASEEIRGGQ